MLDPVDHFALCLAREGTAQPVQILETQATAAVLWDRQFRIRDDIFTTTDKSGQVTSFIGYPTESIRAALQRATQQQAPD